MNNLKALELYATVRRQQFIDLTDTLKGTWLGDQYRGSKLEASFVYFTGSDYSVELFCSKRKCNLVPVRPYPSDKELPGFDKLSINNLYVLVKEPRVAPKCGSCGNKKIPSDATYCWYCNS